MKEKSEFWRTPDGKYFKLTDATKREILLLDFAGCEQFPPVTEFLAVAESEANEQALPN